MEPGIEPRAAATTAPAAAPPARRPLPDELRAQLERSYAVDLSAIAVVEDGVAEQLGKPAAAHGRDLHFARGAYDPVGDVGRHVIAHEVAHVVQQGAVPRTSAATAAHAGESTGSLEQEAELAAFAALRDQPARLSHGRAAVGVQGFESWEHWLVAMRGGGGKLYTYGSMVVSQGDLCALAGDYFDPHPDAPAEDSLLVHLQVPSMRPGQTPGTQDEVLAALRDAFPRDPRLAPGGPWNGIAIGDEVQTAMKQRFSRLAVRNRDHFAQPETGKPAHGDRESAGGSYRALHEAAIWTAYTAGARGDTVEADALEASAEHFLTDSFSAGHVRTPRAEIQRYWDAMYPAFATNLVNLMATRIALRMSTPEHREAVGSVARAGIPLYGTEVATVAAGILDRYEPRILAVKARDMILAKLGSGGVPGLGDILSLVIHNHDNRLGLWVENDLGMTWFAKGDRHMLDTGTSQVAPIVLAVQLGCDDIQRAHRLGGSAAGRPRTEVLAAIRATSPAPAHPSDERYASEQALPRPVAGKNGEQFIRDKDFEHLLDHEIRSDDATTFRAAISAECRDGGAIHEQLAQTAATLDEIQSIYFPRQAFVEGVLEPLEANPIAVLLDALWGR